jgi:hypothetical protein
VPTAPDVVVDAGAFDAGGMGTDASLPLDAESPDASDAPVDPCSGARACGACVVLSGCGFCSTTGTCETASADGSGSADGTCTGHAWKSGPGSCGGHDDAGTDAPVADAPVADAGAPCTSNADCDATEYCQYRSSSSTGGGGTCSGSAACAPRPLHCTGVDAMACGCDGMDYPSPCAANMAGVPWLHLGLCTDGGVHDAGSHPPSDASASGSGL